MINDIKAYCTGGVLKKVFIYNLRKKFFIFDLVLSNLNVKANILIYDEQMFVFNALSYRYKNYFKG